MKTACSLIASCLVAILPALAAANAPDDPEWGMFRHDTWLSGHSPLKGAIATPRVLAQYDLRAWDNVLTAHLGGKAGPGVALRSEAFEPGYVSAHQAEWGAGPVMLDLAGDGKLTPVYEANYTRYANIIPGSKGLQKIHSDDYFGTGKANERKLYAYTFEPGNADPKLLWESGPWGELEGTTLTVVDADNDGQVDIVGNTWGRIFVWDAITGKQKMFLQWHPPMRDYGYFAAVKLGPTDPTPQFIVVGDFVTHIDLIRNDGKTLSVGWRRPVEEVLGEQQRGCRPLVNSAQDADGDGEIEIVVNIFNETGDDRWHVMVLDAATGKVEADHPGSFVYAAEDIDGDGRAELFCGETKASLLSDPAKLWVGGLPGTAGGVQAPALQVKLAVREAGMWEFAQVRQLPLNVETMAAQGRRTVRLADVDGDGGRECFVRTPAGLVMYGKTPGGLARKGLIAGPGLSVLGQQKSASGKSEDLLLRSSIAAGQAAQATLTGGRLQLVSCAPRVGPVNPPVVARLAGTQGASIVLEDALERINCLRWTAGGVQAPALQRRWAQPGRSQSPDRGNCYGVVAADLDGLAGKEVVYGRAAADGSAEVLAARGDGKPLWTHAFPRFAGRAPDWNFNGLTHWTVGRFTGRGGCDVAVSLRRGNMHTDQTHLLDGRTGQEVWTGISAAGDPSADRRRGFGGAVTSATDVDGDGAEDILCAYPDEFYIASGKTGKLLRQKWASDIFPGGWLAYAIPVLGRFLPDGSVAAMWTQGGYRRGVMTLAGEKVWNFDYMDGYGSMPGIGDVNGDGRLEGLSAQKKGTTCYDMATGTVRWTLPEFAQTSDAVTCDIDGEGRDEFVYGSGNKLVAVNEDQGKPHVVWALDMGAGLGSPAVADVDGDGAAEVVVMGRDGLVRIVGGAE